MTSNIEEFLQKVEEVIRSCLDGRRVRGMSFEWKSKVIPTRRHFFRESRFTSGKLTTKNPEYSDNELEQSKLLAVKDNREFIINLAQVGKARSIDAAEISDTSITEPLLNMGLIQKEYLIICRQDSRTLCSINDKSELEDKIGLNLRCTTCGRSFRDELIQEIFSLTTIVSGVT